MAKPDNQPKTPQPAQVTQLPQRCPADGCGKKPRRAGFCSEHFVWFKEGLIARDGQKAKDFDKKYQAYKRREEHKKAA